jgi:putative transcriptional regulator
MSDIENSILRGAEEALAYAKGDKSKGIDHVVRIPDTVDVKGIRSATGMSQGQFADFYGFKVTALRSWEQGRRKPERTARILLAIIERNPRIVHDILTVETTRYAEAAE